MYSLTESLEDYLEMIYILKQNDEDVRITDIANKLKLSKPSVNKAINSLKSEGLVMHERYGKIKLTEHGEKIAKEVYVRHEIIKNFFINILHIDPVIAEQDACKVEHVLSHESMQRLTEYFSKMVMGDNI